jgi:hypothetical protein
LSVYRTAVFSQPLIQIMTLSSPFIALSLVLHYRHIFFCHVVLVVTLPLHLIALSSL